MKAFAHQDTSIEFFRGKPATFDASDPGTGKTFVIINIIAPRKLHDHRATLVLAPKSLLEAAWVADIRKFAPQLRTSVAYAANREAAFAKDADVYITNHDAAKWLVQQPAKFFKRFHTLVIDESNAFKHHTAQRSKAAAKIAKHFDFVHLMNGTPNTNSITDVWHQYFICDGGRRLGKSFYQFRSSVCKPVQVGPQAQHIAWEDIPGAEQAVAELVADITLRHKLEECIDLPENHMYTRTFELTDAHRKKYEEMRKTHMIEYEEAPVTAINAAAVATKLAQIASGAVYQDVGVYHRVASERYDLIMDLLEPREHSLCFFLWKHQGEELTQAAEKRGYSYAVLDGETSGKERENIVRQFQAGIYKVLFAHPQSAAHGLTLTRAKTTIWASPTFNLEHFAQGNRRIYRAGQTARTETIVVIAKDTIDEKVYRQLETKKVRMDALLEELKEAA